MTRTYLPYGMTRLFDCTVAQTWARAREGGGV
jgi:hypothetical protein